jgi:hypothetical protein
MNLREETLKLVTRRQFFKDCGAGLGTLALASLLNDKLFAAAASPADPLFPKVPHFAPKAKNIIYLHMAGAPSQLDLLDYKPKLVELNNQKIPEEMIKNERFAFHQRRAQAAWFPAQVQEARPIGRRDFGRLALSRNHR